MATTSTKLVSLARNMNSAYTIIENMVNVNIAWFMLYRISNFISTNLTITYNLTKTTVSCYTRTLLLIRKLPETLLGNKIQLIQFRVVSSQARVGGSVVWQLYFYWSAVIDRVVSLATSLGALLLIYKVFSLVDFGRFSQSQNDG